ncbi:MAG: cyclic pyranopterin phosphate synthase, partial [Alphaproteobacteria bacterium PA3]
MAEQMVFLPRCEILSLEEIARLAEAFVARGVRRIRLTGGEPLVRRGATEVARQIGRLIGHGLDELTITTNGASLAKHADDLWDAGIRRINVSLDTLDPNAFRQISRGGDLASVLAGIHAARAQDLDVKINMVALKNENEDALLPMADFCAEHGLDLTLIETMPLGAGVLDREERYIALDAFTAP